MSKPGIAAVAIALIAASTISASDSVDVRRLIREGRYGEAERVARAHLVDVDARPDVTPRQLADALDLAAEAVWRDWSVAPDSIALAERALKVREGISKGNDPALATSLFNLARVAHKREDYERARELDERALEIREAVLAPEDPALVQSLSYPAQYLAIHFSERDHAKVLLDRALAISERRGFDDPSAAVALRLRGDFASLATEFAQGEAYYRRCLDLPAAALDPVHADRSLCWGNLAVALRTHGDPRGAKAASEHALSIREVAFGPDHPATAMALGILATDAFDLDGDEAGAATKLRRAIRITEAAYGPGHNLAFSLRGDLAGILALIGETAQALEVLETAVTIQERTRKPGDPDLGDLVSTKLGLVLKQIGDLEAAEYWLKRARRATEAQYGEHHRWAWAARLNLADVAALGGDWEEALSGFEGVVTDADASGVGPNEEMLADALHGLGQAVWHVKRDAPKARALHERALAIREATFGPDHTDVAASLENLGSFFRESGDAAESRRVLTRALDIRIRHEGNEHPATAATCLSLAKTLVVARDEAAALRLALDAERGGRNHLQLLGGSVSEDLALRYSGSRLSGLDLALSIVAGGKASADERREVLDQVIRSRAVVYDAMAARAEGVREASRGKTGVRRVAYNEATARLAHLILRGPSDRTEAEYRELLRTVRTDQAKAEREIVAASPRFRASKNAEGVGFEQVAGALREGQALASIVRFGRGEPPTSMYAAFVVGGSGAPTFVELGDAKRIDGLITAWKREASRRPEAGDAALDAYRSVAITLRESVWDPIVRAAGGATEILLVPDGAIHTVSFGALPDDKRKFLVESGLGVSVFTAERDLVVGPARDVSRELLAVGGVNFDSAKNTKEPMEPAVFRGAPPSCRESRQFHFAPLPGSAEEIARVTSLWSDGNTVQLTGPEATERAFKVAAPGRSAIHLATHGMFLSGSCKGGTATSAERGVGALVGDVESAAQPPPASKRTVENPLRLAALAFAGANRAADAPPDADDGILTMEEVAALDLSAAKWVVLSACDTATGDVLDSEGVLGLRRAFRTAGAGAVVASLWAVDDRATTEWMTALYRARKKTRGASDAVREASRSILRARRAAGLDDHPFWWGGFVGGR